ncbi:cell cycle negative regulator roughex [Drosophila guanche]|uniref:Blast:Cell cycle negative regulator roughex n=1 Tax=Drosophila guanche TaxID=7266 RepID=A0A3B0JVL3_DROGU|nr:cell cycle negative regulator roughex [Drosophila guanche]SPP77759.1 blast:Cell cycle negative regulator roughex [Drosophila guanche]
MNANGSNQTAGTHAPAQPSPSEIVQNFIVGVDTGLVRADLADDCILSLFGRHIRGVVAVTGFIRTQIFNRFKHIGFEEARPCTPSKEVAIKERFGRSFDRVRRRIHEQKERERANADVGVRRLAVDDMEEDVDALPRSSPHLVTPPRPTRHVMDMLQYIEARGVMEDVEGNSNDGGIQLGDSQHVLLTLGYRHTQTASLSLRDIEICLAVYEDYRTFPRQRARASAAITSNPLTDDEAEEPAVSGLLRGHLRSVRRTLFARAESEEPEQNPLEDSAEPVPTEPSPSSSQSQCESQGPVPVPPTPPPPPPAADGAGDMPATSTGYPTRKRQQQRETEVSPKRPGRYGLRF